MAGSPKPRQKPINQQKIQQVRQELELENRNLESRLNQYVADAEVNIGIQHQQKLEALSKASDDVDRNRTLLLSNRATFMQQAQRITQALIQQQQAANTVAQNKLRSANRQNVNAQNNAIRQRKFL